MGRLLMKVIRRLDERNQRATDRGEERRRNSPHGWEVTGPHGRFFLVGHPRGYPIPDTYLKESFWMPAALGLTVETWRAIQHRYRYRKSWVVSVSPLDEMGFRTGNTREVVVESKLAAVPVISDISGVLQEEGLAGLDARISAGGYFSAKG